MKITALALLASLGLVACSDGEETAKTKTDSQYEQEVIDGMHATLLSDIQALHDAAIELETAAPTPEGRGWDADEDADAIEAVTNAWLKARSAYERTEGALAPLFPDIDAAIDARYEDFLEEIGEDGDQNLFDDEGVTGMHAIERILFASEIPDSVITTEESLPGYKEAAWPATEDEAKDFKDKLAARMVSDTEELLSQWEPQNIDIAAAFGGLISLMDEQREKVNKAASDEEESRYAQRTMADIRDNLAGTTRAYDLFEPWLLTKPEGESINADIHGSFEALSTAYADISGDAIPAPPKTWSSEEPSQDDLSTPFGKLYSTVNDAVDPNREGSAVDGMNRAAEALGFPEFVEE